MSSGLDDLAQPRIHTLNRVGRVDHAAHLGREGKERDDLVPGPAPGAGDSGELLPPRPSLECVQLGLGRFGVDRCVDRLDGRGQRLAILP